MRTWKPRRPVVLIVDDDPDILHVLGLILAAEGCDVREALSGAEALAALDRVDVLIVDQRMPQMFGTELVVAAQAQGFMGRVLLISGSDDVRTQAGSARIDSFLAKPIGPQRLMREIERLFYLNIHTRRTNREQRSSEIPLKA
jgi:DNA-binding NtrC family response regulator